MKQKNYAASGRLLIDMIDHCVELNKKRLSAGQKGFLPVLTG